MASLWHVLFFSLIGGVASLVGGLLLFSSPKADRTATITRYVTPFAAGALLAAAFFDLLPEAAHQGSVDYGLIGALVGILLFFVLEGALHWFHHHKHSEEHANPNVALIIIGDTVHNFIDGIAIAIAFLVSIPVGIVATLAVAAHEIPQEIGDFGLMLSKGLSKRKVIIVNVLSALATTVAALLFFHLGASYELPLDLILGLVAGFFIYIAVSDIIPDIHRNHSRKRMQLQSLILLLGVLMVGVSTSLLHRYIEVDATQSNDATPHRSLHEDHGHEHGHEDENTH